MSKQQREAIDGIFLLNKPIGKTSNFVLQRVKHAFNAQKAGHTGSLDPLATGMLPICFGQATKFSQYLLDADKCYQVTGRLGIKTDSSDSTGMITQQVDVIDISRDQLWEAIQQFIGEIYQTPSMFSALKHKGLPLYKYARAGQEVERKSRLISIYDIVLDEFDGEFFKLTVTCSKGTYIRNLVEDIGDALTVGAHVTALHRCYTAGFEDQPMYDLETVQAMEKDEQKTLLLSIEKAVDQFPKIRLTSEKIKCLQQGQPVSCNEVLAANQLLRIYDSSERFMGLGELNDQKNIKANRLMAY